MILVSYLGIIGKTTKERGFIDISMNIVKRRATTHRISYYYLKKSSDIFSEYLPGRIIKKAKLNVTTIKIKMFRLVRAQNSTAKSSQPHVFLILMEFIEM